MGDLASPKYRARANLSPITRLAREAYQDEIDANGGHCDTSLVRERLTGLLSEVDIDLIKAKAVQLAVDEEDRRRRDLANTGQLNLFDDAVFDGVIPATGGDSKRVRLGDASNDDWLYWLQVGQKHVNEVVSMQNSRLETYTKLAPYLARGMVTSDARQQYMTDHPDDTLPNDKKN